MKKAILIAVFACALVAVTWTAPHAEEATTMTVEVTGKNVNLVKALCGDEAPEADADFGGLNALHVQEAVDAEGNAVEGLAGKLLHYLPVAAASSLISGDENADKVITVKGLLYKDALVIAVQEVEIKVAEEASGDDGDGFDDWDDWDELGVTTMSQQQVI